MSHLITFEANSPDVFARRLTLILVRPFFLLQLFIHGDFALILLLIIEFIQAAKLTHFVDSHLLELLPDPIALGSYVI